MRLRHGGIASRSIVGGGAGAHMGRRAGRRLGSAGLGPNPNAGARKMTTFTKVGLCYMAAITMITVVVSLV